MNYINRILFFAALSFIFACGNDKKSDVQASVAKPKSSNAVVIATLPTFDCLPLYWAESKGLLKQEGLDVELKMYPSQMDGDTAILRGHVQGVVSDLVRMERIKQKLPYLTYFSSTSLSWQLYTNKTARIKTIQQLSEKMVGMTRFSGTDYWTDRVVKEAKPKNEVFRVQLNDLNVRWKMLQNNEIDAVWLSEPYSTKARLRQCQKVYDTEGKDMMMGVIAFNKKELDKKLNNNGLEQLIKVYNQACDSLNQYTVEHYIGVLEKYYGLTERDIKALPRMHFHHVLKPRQLDIEAARRFLNLK